MKTIIINYVVIYVETKTIKVKIALQFNKIKKIKILITSKVIKVEIALQLKNIN